MQLTDAYVDPTWSITQASVGAALNDQPTYKEYTFVGDGTVRRDWK
jgi:hypothetical protein